MRKNNWCYLKMFCKGVWMSMHMYQTEQALYSDAEGEGMRARAHEPGVERISAIILSSSLFFLRKLMLKEAYLLLKS